MKKISEIVVNKTVHRPVRGNNGTLYHEELTFAMAYNPAIQSHFPRLWAKLIDLAPIFLLLMVIIRDSWWATVISVPLVIIYGTIAEHLKGATLGKMLLRLKVLDDDGKYPSWLVSFKRNALAPLNLSQHPGVKFKYPDPEWSTHRYNMNLNNNICNTYVVEANKVQDIREMLK